MKTSRMIFFGSDPYEDGYLARMTTAGEIEVPVNVYADPGTDFLMPWGTACEAWRTRAPWRSSPGRRTTSGRT